MSEVTFTFTVPPAGGSTFEFRRAFVGVIRDAIAKKQMAGEIDAPLADEMFRALPIEEPRQ